MPEPKYKTQSLSLQFPQKNDRVHEKKQDNIICIHNSRQS